MRRADVTRHTPVSELRELARFPTPDPWPEGAATWFNVQAAHAVEMDRFINTWAANHPSFETLEGQKAKSGIVICAGGLYLASAYVTLQALRKVGCPLPVEVWHLPGEVSGDDTLYFRHGGRVRFREAEGQMSGWQLKPYALRHSHFRNVLLLDADCYPVQDPAALFEGEPYQKTGALFFPDSAEQDFKDHTWKALGYDETPPDPRAQESGIMFVDTVRHWLPLELAQWMNDRHQFFYQLFWGDKDTYHLAWRRLRAQYTLMPRRWCISGPALVHYDFGGRPLAVHRVLDKFKVTRDPQFHPQLPFEAECRGWLKEYKRQVARY